jgi:hypothetical protein
MNEVCGTLLPNQIELRGFLRQGKVLLVSEIGRKHAQRRIYVSTNTPK